mmetsp:Transcript_5096/g.7858  ORF Transcript_5096/g.7858 Transcript_5096/m.7858 type:complete len:230 (+) Transcript_5096:961-1650(+)
MGQSLAHVLSILRKKPQGLFRVRIRVPVILEIKMRLSPVGTISRHVLTYIVAIHCQGLGVVLGSLSEEFERPLFYPRLVLKCARFLHLQQRPQPHTDELVALIALFLRSVLSCFCHFRCVDSLLERRAIYLRVKSFGYVRPLCLRQLLNRTPVSFFGVTGVLIKPVVEPLALLLQGIGSFVAVEVFPSVHLHFRRRPRSSKFVAMSWRVIIIIVVDRRLSCNFHLPLII